MKVASGQTGLDQCPRLGDDAMSELSEASAPPQRLIKIGPDPDPIQIGQETVMFRHEERFHHPVAIALKLPADAAEGELRDACAAFKELKFTRVGQEICPDMIALVDEAGDGEAIVKAAEIVQGEVGVPLVLVSPNAEALAKAATGPLAGKRPLIYLSGDITVDNIADLAGKAKAPVCVAGSIENVAETVEALNKKDIKDIVISAGHVPAAEGLVFLTKTRRAALQKKYRPLGCPSLAIACGGEDKVAGMLDACTYVCKYAGVVITDAWEPHLLVPILTARQNIFTDPQKPVQVEPKVYEIGEVTKQSPLLVTTNFSLSYYSVESEVEASRVPCRILAVDTEGTSVLTAWAADKFNAQTITEAINAAGGDELADHHKLILPGHVAVITAQLADDSGWEVLVGPKDASGIGPYLKNEWKA